VATKEQIRTAAEEDLSFFIKLIAPHRVLGSIHEEVIDWWCREGAKSHQLLLLPRDHQKSALVAYRVAWEITKNPAVTILYISSTANLAQKQLTFIKNILDSKIYRRYWSEMTHPDEGKREKWAADEFSVDHPLRKEEGVRDPTVFTGGLTTGLTGLHCNIAVLDDVVVQENAYVKDGREKVKNQYSLLASIETTEALEWVVGTRYHGNDLYGELQDIVAEVVDENGVVVTSDLIYETMQREVEDRGDGSGEYLWQRQQRRDGKWFGFNPQILAKKRGQYLNKSQFRAQYYNNPNDPDNEAISHDLFQYYDRKRLERRGSQWEYNGKVLSVFAAVDFAFSLRAKADFSAVVVIGVDAGGNFYVLAIDRFKTNLISEYYKHIMELHSEWNFRKLRAEVTVAQEAIVESLQEQIKQNGLALSIDKWRPTRQHGAKFERIEAVLNPRYENLSIYHYKGGLIQELEDELRQERPPHDDIKDALTNAIDIAVIPRHRKERNKDNVVYNTRFGGVA
jgi:hypothetical protein